MSEPTYTTRHMCMNIAGALRNPQSLKSFTHDNGIPCTVAEARDFLRMEQYKGRRVIPLGEPCEGFDYQTGCPGHPMSKEEYEAKHQEMKMERK